MSTVTIGGREYNEPEWSDLYPGNWDFNLDWDDSMLNPDNPDTMKDWIWLEAGVLTTAAGVLLRAYGPWGLGLWEATQSFGIYRLFSAVRFNYMAATNMYFVAAVVAYNFLDEMDVASTLEGPIVGGGTGPYSGTGYTDLIGDDEWRFTWTEGLHRKEGMRY